MNDSSGRKAMFQASTALRRIAVLQGDLSTAAGDLAAHLAASDPHPQYLTPAEGAAAYDALGAAAAAVGAHVAAGDPHPQYLTVAEGSAAYQPLAAVLTNTTASFTAAQETKLSGIATGATANSTDAFLLARANHTGTQAASTITGLATVATSGSAADLTGTLGAARMPALTGDVTTAAGTVSTTVGKINGVSLAGLATGILKNTTGTGVPSIAAAADFPTLNQNTTGSAATLTTGRTIGMTGDVTWTSASFNGSGNVTGTSTIGTNKVLDGMLRQSAGLSVIGRSANTTGNVADLTAASDGAVLRRSGTTLGFGAIALGSANAVSGTLPVANGGTGDTGTAWTAWTPTVSSGSGTVTGATISTVAKYKAIGKTVFWKISCTITSKGSGSPGGAVLFTTPAGLTPLDAYNPASAFYVNVALLAGAFSSSDGHAYAFQSSGATLWADGNVFVLGGTYEAS